MQAKSKFLPIQNHFSEKPAHIKQWNKRIVFALAMLIDLYGMLLTLLCVGWLLTGESSWILLTFTSLMPGIFSLAPIFALLGLILRRRWLAFHLFPAIVFLGIYGMLFIPRSTMLPMQVSLTGETVPAYESLRVMTWNMHVNAVQLEELAQLIRSADTDVVALQELSESAAKYFDEYLRDDYPYQIAYTNGLSVTGIGFLSRYPLKNEQLQQLSSFFYILKAEIELDGKSITLVNTHPSPPAYGLNFNTKNRSQQITWLLNYLEPYTSNLIVMGDFNMTDQNGDYRRVTANLLDTHREIGMGLGQTFPDMSMGQFPINSVPVLIRIDYIFHSHDLTGVSSQVWQTSGYSDHQAVIAELALFSLSQ